MSNEDVTKRALNWLFNGEVGMSSKTILGFYLGIFVRKDAPHDYADFRRCMKLLELIPEAKEALPDLAQISHHWRELVGQWDELEALYKEVEEGRKTRDEFNDTFYPIAKRGCDKDIKESWLKIKEARHV